MSGQPGETGTGKDRGIRGQAAHGIVRPVDYTARVGYRPPPRLYARLQRIAPLLARVGLVPSYVITIEVRGRRTGRRRRTTVVQVNHEGQAFVVALAGQAQWVRNVRAAQGRVLIRRHRDARAARLVEVPVPERAEVIRAYLLRPGRAGKSRVRVGEAHSYFGVSSSASLDEIRSIAEHYPVFRIEVDPTVDAGIESSGRSPKSRRLTPVALFGATEQERRRSMPGDDLIADPMLQVTQAVTIEAPVAQIWPWLVQTGQGRAGFYADSRWWDACVNAYYRLLSRDQRRPAEGYRYADHEIVPQWQDLQVGDTIADGPPGTAEYVVRELVPQRHLVLYTDTHLPHLMPARWRSRVHGEVSDATLLIPLDDTRTRVVRRARANSEPPLFRLLTLPVVAIWGEVITARNLLRGVKRRAEATPHP